MRRREFLKHSPGVAGALLALRTVASSPGATTATKHTTNIEAIKKALTIRQEGSHFVVELPRGVIPEHDEAHVRFSLVRGNDSADISVHRNVTRARHAKSSDGRLNIFIPESKDIVKLHLYTNDIATTRVEARYYARDAQLPNPGTIFFRNHLQLPVKRFSAKDISIFYHGSIEEQKLREAAEEMHFLNRFIPKSHSVKSMYLRNEIPEAGEDKMGFELAAGRQSLILKIGARKPISHKESPHVIFGKTGAFKGEKSAIHRVLTCHEAIHAILKAEGLSPELSLLFNVMSEIGWIKEEGEKHAFYSVFDESSYLGQSLEIGHPYDTPSELGASAITVMRYFPNEFIKKMDELKRADLKLHKEAVMIAFEVTNFFGNKRKETFSPRVWNYLVKEAKEAKSR